MIIPLFVFYFFLAAAVVSTASGNTGTPVRDKDGTPIDQIPSGAARVEAVISYFTGLYRNNWEQVDYFLNSKQRKVLFTALGNFTVNCGYQACHVVQGAIMAAVRDDLDMDAVKNLAERVWSKHSPLPSIGKGVLIGAQRSRKAQDNGNFIWYADGSLASYANGDRPPQVTPDMPLYKTYWKVGEPDNKGGHESCIRLTDVDDRNKIAWEDVSCTEPQMAVLCQYIYWV